MPTQELSLPCGRTLAYCGHGDAENMQAAIYILSQHALVSIRRSFFHCAAFRHCLRVISPDRGDGNVPPRYQTNNPLLPFWHPAFHRIARDQIVSGSEHEWKWSLKSHTTNLPGWTNHNQASILPALDSRNEIVASSCSGCCVLRSSLIGTMVDWQVWDSSSTSPSR